MAKDRNGFRKKYSVQQTQARHGQGDQLYLQKFDHIESQRDNGSLNLNDQINLQNMSKIPSFHSTSPFVKENSINDNGFRNNNQFHSLTDAAPTVDMSKNYRNSFHKNGLLESNSMISSSKMITMKAELSSIDNVDGNSDLTPNKNQEIYQDDTTFNLMNVTAKNQRTLQQTISPISTHAKAVSSRLHSLYDQPNYETNRVRIIDQQLGEVGSKNISIQNETASYSMEPHKPQMRSASHHLDPLNMTKSNSGLKNLRKMNRAAILEEIEKNKIEEIKNNLSNNKLFRKPKPFPVAANYSSKNSQPDAVNLKNLQKVINSSIVNHSSSTAAEESLNLKLAKGQRERNLNGISRIGGLAQFAMDNQASNTSSSMMQSCQISQNHLNQEINEIDKNLCDLNLASQDMMQDKKMSGKKSLVAAQAKYSPFNYGGVFDSQNHSSVNFKSKQWRGNSSQRESQTQVIVQSQNSLDLSPSFQYSRAALMQLKESSHSPYKKDPDSQENGVNDFQYAKLKYQNGTNSLYQKPKQSLEASITSKETKLNDNTPKKNKEVDVVKSKDGEMQDSQTLQQQLFRQKLNKSRQLMAVNRKLSSVLEASPLKNSYIGRIFHDRYQNHLQQPDGSLTLANILNETLSKLKGRGPNKAILQPIKITSSPFKKCANDTISQLPTTGHRYNNIPLKESLDPQYQLNTLPQKGSFTGSQVRAGSRSRGAHDSIEGETIAEGTTGDGITPPITIRDIVGGDDDVGEGMTRRARKSDLQMSSAMNVLEGVMENEQQSQNNNQQSVEKRNEVVDQLMEDLDLDELTQEDKFFLIQQIEDLNKNIRYCQNASPYIFEEDDNQSKPLISQSPDLAPNSPFTKGQKAGKDELQGKQHFFGREKFHKHGARGVRGAKKLDIILDEEEDNYQEGNALSADEDGSESAQDQLDDALVSGLTRDREKGSFFYKKKESRHQRANRIRSFNPSPNGSDEVMENHNSDDMSQKKLTDSPDGGSYKKKSNLEENGPNKHRILCQKQSYMIESFDGGQTLRHDNQDDEPGDDVAYRPDKPVSINSSIEIVSKKKSSREMMNMNSHRSPIDLTMTDRQKKKQKFLTQRHNLNLNQITSLSQLKRIKVHVEELEEDQSEQVQNKFKSRKQSMALRRNQDELEERQRAPMQAQNDEEVRNISSACSSAQS